MLPKKHFLYGLIFSLVLFLIFPLTILEACLIFLASFLLDVDHYLYSVFSTGSLSLSKAYREVIKKGKKFDKLSKEEKREYVAGFLCFHGLETLVLLGILGYFISSYFYFILIGTAFHLVLDYIQGIKEFHYPLKISVIWDYFQFKKLKKL